MYDIKSKQDRRKQKKEKKKMGYYKQLVKADTNAE